MLYSLTWFPPRSKLDVYSRGKRLLPFFEGGKIDLADTVMLRWPHAQRTVELRLTTKSKRWSVWDDEAMKNVEEYIRYDFGFDNYSVVIRRLSGMGQPCSAEMRWKLIVRPKS